VTVVFQPRLIPSSKVFPVVFFRSVHSSALFLPSRCSSLLLHVAANLICIFLVSSQMVLLSDLTKFLHSFRGQNLCTDCSCKMFNLLTPNDVYSGRTAPLTSKCCILYIYSTNIGTEYFKHLRFFLFKMQFVS